LDQVSRELKISCRFLQAIEQEQFDRLPGGVFAKSFVRQYARMLDLDEEEAAAAVQRTLRPANAPQFAESAPKVARLGTTEFSPRVDSISPRRLDSGSWLPALGLVVAVMLGCSIIFGLWQRQHRTAAANSARHELSPKTQTAITSTPAVPSATNDSTALDSVAPPDGLAQTAPAAAAVVPQGASSQPVPANAGTADSAPEIAGAPPALKPSGPLKVAITADEPVWILARTDGKFAFSGTLAANETRTVEAGGLVLLRLGNAGGVAITVNGKPIPAVGPKGQVRTVQLTSGGFQIVAPPKPSALPDGLL
jgi:cytoskeleton protein RodZ